MKYILCAKVGAPFGIKGALHLYAFSGQQDSLLGLSSFYTKAGESYEKCEIVSIRPHGDHLVITLKDIVTPEEASIWTNRELYINADDLPKLPKGRYYWHELIGMKVQGLKQEDYGVVVECYNNHHDVLKTSLGHHIPFISGDTVQLVDKKTKIIYIDYDINAGDDDEVDFD